MRKWRHGDSKNISQKIHSELQNWSLVYMAVTVQSRILDKEPMSSSKRWYNYRNLLEEILILESEPQTLSIKEKVLSPAVQKCLLMLSTCLRTTSVSWWCHSCLLHSRNRECGGRGGAHNFTPSWPEDVLFLLCEPPYPTRYRQKWQGKTYAFS